MAKQLEEIPYDPENHDELYKEFLELLSENPSPSVKVFKPLEKQDVCHCDSRDLFNFGCRCKKRPSNRL